LHQAASDQKAVETKCAQPAKLVWALNNQDRYNDPGRPLQHALANGHSAILQSGDYIFLDLGPDAEKAGCLIVQRSDTDDPDPVAPSFKAWLEDFADKLEDDEFAYSEEEGEIMYADEIDLD